MSSEHLDTGDQEVNDSIAEIMAGTEGQTDWALFGYYPKSNRLRLVGKGNGGIKEFIGELSDGSVLFGFIRFQVSHTSKFVFVSWCGEGVMGLAKSYYTNHSKEMETFMKLRGRGFHIQINARNEKDLDEKSIIDKINRYKGANFLAAKTSTEAKGPALKDESSEYWNKQKKVDESHEAAMQQHLKRKEESLLKQRDDQSERISSEAGRRQREVEANREAEVARRRAAAGQRDSEDQQRRDRQAEETRRRLADRDVPQIPYGAGRKESAPAPAHNVYNAPEPNPSQASAVGRNQRGTTVFPSGGAGNLKSRFEQLAQNEATPPPPPVKSVAKPPAAAKPPPAFSNTSAPPPAAKPAPPPPAAKSFTPPPPPPPEESWEEPQQSYEESQQSYEEPQQSYEEPQYEEPPPQPPQEESWEEPQQSYEEPPQEQYGEEAGGGGGGGGAAQLRALYEYPGEQEGDLAFHEGDIINLIDNSDPSGWWEGELNGVTGFFPSNFVEYA